MVHGTRFAPLILILGTHCATQKFMTATRTSVGNFTRNIFLGDKELTVGSNEAPFLARFRNARGNGVGQSYERQWFQPGSAKNYRRREAIRG